MIKNFEKNATTKAILHKEKSFVHYEYHKSSKNNAETLVLISGSSEGIAAWLPYLEDFCKDFNVLTIDNPGIGQSDYRQVFTPASLAEEYLEIIAKEGIEEFHLWGHSQGAAIALEMTYAKQETVKGLTLIAGLVGAFMQKQIAQFQMNLCDEVCKHLDKPEELPQCYEVLFGDCPNKKQMAIDWFKHYKTNVKPGASFAFIRSNFQHSFIARLPEITVPVLLVHGNKDELVIFENSLIMLTLMPNAKLLEVNGGGHYIAKEQPVVMDQMLENTKGKSIGVAEYDYQIDFENAKLQEQIFIERRKDQDAYNAVISDMFKPQNLTIEARYKAFSNYISGK